MRLLLLLTAAGALRAPMSNLRKTAHGLAAKTVAREDATTSRLLALEAERTKAPQTALAAEPAEQPGPAVPPSGAGGAGDAGRALVSYDDL